MSMWCHYVWGRSLLPTSRLQKHLSITGVLVYSFPKDIFPIFLLRWGRGSCPAVQSHGGDLRVSLLLKRAPEWPPAFQPHHYPHSHLFLNCLEVLQLCHATAQLLPRKLRISLSQASQAVTHIHLFSSFQNSVLVILLFFLSVVLWLLFWWSVFNQKSLETILLKGITQGRTL